MSLTKRGFIPMYPFSKETLDLLHQAGWQEDRHIDPTEYERLLEKYGYPVIPAVHDFLQSFGGLKFRHPHFYAEGVWEELDLSIDEYDANNKTDSAVVLGKWIGTPVCLIGTCYNGLIFLFMAASGYVYGDADAYFMIGTSGPDAIEALCTRREFTDILPATD